MYGYTHTYTMRETEVGGEPDYRINLPSGAVVDVTVKKVEPWEKFRSGWHYSLHYGTQRAKQYCVMTTDTPTTKTTDTNEANARL